MGTWKRSEPGLAWYVIFEDQPRAITEIRRDGDLFAHFDLTLLLGHIEKRRVKAMWIIARSSDNGDVVRAYGRVPAAISDRLATERLARANTAPDAPVVRPAARKGRTLPYPR
jgi:hypothetical protein